MTGYLSLELDVVNRNLTEDRTVERIRLDKMVN